MAFNGAMHMQSGVLRDLRGLGDRLPKIPVASAISGLIVAALILMTPNTWFEAFIVESGLPELVAAATPPLGAKARIVFALIAAGTITVVAWGVLSLLMRDRLVGSARKRTTDEGWEFDKPAPMQRLRRADAHPDAPPRRPIFATDDLGTPLDLVTVASDEDEPAGDEEAFELTEAFADQDVGEPAASVEPRADGGADEGETIEDDIAPDTPVFAIPLRGGDAFDEPATDEVAEPVAAAPEPQDDPIPSVPVAADSRAELAALVDRLAAGLDRRRARLQGAEAVSSAGAGNPHGDTDVDGALRDALDALRRLSAKGA